MIRNLLVLPTGEELFSGAVEENAISSVTVTGCVNSEVELCPGAVCANMLEASVIAHKPLSLKAGEEVVLYCVSDSGERIMKGIYIAEKPAWESANRYTLIAYDRVSKLDKDLTSWLEGLSGWPYSLLDFASMVCSECGLELITQELPNGDYSVQAFSAERITGRQLIQWAGQAAGRFCRATKDGRIEFAWYQETGMVVGPEEKTEQSGFHQDYYFMGSLSYEDYQTDPIEKVQIRLTEDDVGAIYPDDPEKTNTYVLSGNYLLTNTDAQALEAVAQNLFEELKEITYTPCKIEIPISAEVEAGDIITVTDKNGKSITVYVMDWTVIGQRCKLECSGSPRRDSVTAVNEQTYKALSGKVLELRTDVEGLRAEHRNAQGDYSSLAVTVEGIAAEVSRQQTSEGNILQQVSRIQQTAGELSITVQSLQDNGVKKVQTQKGYTFDDEGLLISQEGAEMRNLLDNSGMYVKRNADTVLQANNDGVQAINISVKNYLTVGKYARFEDYNNGDDSVRTACFWTGG